MPDLPPSDKGSSDPPRNDFELENPTAHEGRFEVKGFEILGSEPAADPSDDPAEWIYNDIDAQEAALQELAADIVKYDAGLTNILAGFATESISKDEMNGQIEAWKASFTPKKHGYTVVKPSPEPWLE